MKYLGKIFEYSWGYDMTINDFVIVIDETPKTCIVQKIGKRKLTGGGYVGSEVPVRTIKIGKPFRLKKDFEYSKRFGELALRGTDKSELQNTDYSDPHTWTLWNGKPKYYNTMD